MLIKIKDGDKTLQFDSRKVRIAILLDPASKEAVDKMGPDEPLIVAAPLDEMRNNSAEVWQWALGNWEGATLITGSQPLVGVGGQPLKG